MDEALKKAYRKVQAIEISINFLINAGLNALLAWLIHMNAERVPTDFWSLFIEAVITCLCVCLLVTLFGSMSCRRYRKAGLVLVSGKKSWTDDLPRGTFLLGVTLFGLAVLVTVPVLGAGFALLGVYSLPLTGFITFKGIFGGVLGAVCCSLVLRRRLYE